MKPIRIRRREAGGGTLVELTVVLVIVGILALTQLNSGLGVLERVSRSTASLRPPPGALHNRNAQVQTYYYAPPGARTPAGPTGQAAGPAPGPQPPPTPMRQKLALALHRAADWLETPGTAGTGHPARSGEKRFCVGSFCV